MSNTFMSPLPTFTLESLVTSGQWAAVQSTRRNRVSEKSTGEKADSAAASENDEVSRVSD